MSDPARCWAPKPLRPMVKLALIRQFRYVYAAIGPQEGSLHWMVSEKMNTESMGQFLAQVGSAHPDRHVVIVLDGASSHRALALPVPDNVSLIHLPPYSPELNPTEILWHELREKHCSNRVFDSLDAVVAQVEQGLAAFASNPADVSRLSAWPWIMNSITLNAT
jgi:transposase-like protein